MEELNDMEPNLTQIKKEKPEKLFPTPNGYFDQFEDKLKYKLAENKMRIDKQPTMVAFRPYIAIAASLVLLFVIWQIIATFRNDSLINQQVITNSDSNFNAFYVEEEDVLAFLLDQADSTQVEDSILDQSLDLFIVDEEIILSNASGSSVADSLSDEIITYLVDEDVDITLLEEFL